MRATIYYDSGVRVRMQVAVLDQWLKKNGSQYHEECYRIYDGEALTYHFVGCDGMEISLDRNPTHLESWMDYDLFRCMLEYDDDALNQPESESIKNIVEALELFWQAGIPTFVAGYDDYNLPFNGGVDGPVPWPES